MKYAINRLLGGGTLRPRPYEKWCLEHFYAAFSPDAQRILSAQLADVDLIQRFSDDKLILFFFKNDKKSDFPRFSNTSEELYAARLRIRHAVSLQRMKCDLVTSQGRLSSLELDRAPKSLKPADMICEGVSIFHDLTLPSPTAIELKIDVDRQPILARIGLLFPVAEARPPVSQQEIQSFLEQLAAAVPPDYLELLVETNGFDVNGWTFYGTSSRQIVLPEANYQLLAERDPLALVVRQGQEGSEVFLFDQINAELGMANNSFVEAFLNVISRETKL